MVVENPRWAGPQRHTATALNMTENRNEGERIKSSEQTPRGSSSNCLAPTVVVNADTWPGIDGKKYKFLSKHPLQSRINPLFQSHFQTASPSLVSPRSTLSTCPPTRSYVHRSLLGYQRTTTSFACKQCQYPAIVKMSHDSRHMILDLASKRILRSIDIEWRLRLTISRIPENLFAISKPTSSQPSTSK